MSNLIGVAAEQIEVKDDGGSSVLIAPGLHPAVITNVEEGTTENGNDYVDYYFHINGGVNQGVTIRSREWPVSTSEAGQNIYNKKLKSLLTICNVQGTLQSLTQFHGIQMLINNKPYPRKDTGEMQNSINYYRSYDPNAKLAVEVASVAPAPIAPAPAQVAPAPQLVPQAIPAPQPIPAPQQAGVVPQQIPPAPTPPPQPAPAPAPVQAAQVAAAPVAVQAAAGVQPAPVAQFAVNPVQQQIPAAPDVGNGENMA